MYICSDLNQTSSCKLLQLFVNAHDGSFPHVKQMTIGNGLITSSWQTYVHTSSVQCCVSRDGLGNNRIFCTMLCV